MYLNPHLPNSKVIEPEDEKFGHLCTFNEITEKWLAAILARGYPVYLYEDYSGKGDTIVLVGTTAFRVASGWVQHFKRTFGRTQRKSNTVGEVFIQPKNTEEN